MFQHGEQTGVHKIQLPTDTGSEPSLGAEDGARSKFLPVLTKVVFDLVASKRAQAPRLRAGLRPGIPSCLSRDEEQRGAHVAATCDLTFGRLTRWQYDDAG